MAVRVPDNIPLPDTAFGGPQLPQNNQHPTSYVLSDLRTGSNLALSLGAKRKRAESEFSAAECLHNQNRNACQVPGLGFDHCAAESVGAEEVDVCKDCVVDCDDALCQAASDEQCTDQCIVVPCTDQDHNVCPDICADEVCEVEHCDGRKECTLDESLQVLCCTDYHDYLTPANINATASHFNWDCSLADILGVNANQNINGFPGSTQFSHSNNQMVNIQPQPNTGMNGIACDSPLLNAAFQESSAPESLLSTPSQGHVSPATSQPIAQQQVVGNDFVCRWLECNASFGSLNELVGHVNLTHLRPPTQTASPRPAKRVCLDSSSPQTLFPLSCHWDDCNIYPDASTLPGPSSGLQPGMAFDLLANHFMHDHLGLTVPPPALFNETGFSSRETQEKIKTMQNQSIGGSGDQDALLQITLPPPHKSALSSENEQEIAQGQVQVGAEPSYATPEPSPPPTFTPSSEHPSHDCTSSPHICHWVGCGLSFPSCAALTAHLAAAHVGSGKGRYDCHWRECKRSGEHGFTSKQKVMRHLQAHTGHRPFLCVECGAYFSEAATLAQHMRRHTQEKPFVCDFPGCGKAFAITGALTIHKRTHNGERPFHCPHCQRAFAESSNLSKHLRTHTGDRPYRCLEPGCGKAFARPDQLQRHGNVHARKKTAAESESAAGSVSASAYGEGVKLAVQ